MALKRVLLRVQIHFIVNPSQRVNMRLSTGDSRPGLALEHIVYPMVSCAGCTILVLVALYSVVVW